MPANALKVFLLETELFEGPVARAPKVMESEVNAGMSRANALRMAREQQENAKVELAEITETQVLINETQSKEVDNLRKE